MKKFFQRLLARLGLSLGHWLSLLPLSYQRQFARLIGWTLHLLALKRKKIVRRNLALCLPEYPIQKLRQVEKQFFENFSIALIDLFWLWSKPEDEIIRRVKLVGVEHLESVVQNSNKPVILFAPHFLGIDAGGTRLQIDYPLACLYSNQSIPEVDRWIMQGRARFGQATLISRREGIGKLARLLKQGAMIHFSPDMDFGPRGSVFAPFFGQPTATPNSIDRLSKLSGATIVPMVTRITVSGYETRFYPGWTPREEDDDILGATRLNRFIEARIREDPAQYLWSHKRFKTRPPGLASLYD